MMMMMEVVEERMMMTVGGMKIHTGVMVLVVPQFSIRRHGWYCHLFSSIHANEPCQGPNNTATRLMVHDFFLVANVVLLLLVCLHFSSIVSSECSLFMHKTWAKKQLISTAACLDLWIFRKEGIAKAFSPPRTSTWPPNNSCSAIAIIEGRDESSDVDETSLVHSTWFTRFGVSHSFARDEAFWRRNEIRKQLHIAGST